MPIAASLLPEFDHEMAATRRVLALVPDDQASWRPHEKSFSLGDLARHVSNMALWGTMTTTRDEIDLAAPEVNRPMPFEGTAALLRDFDAGVTAFRAAIAAASDDAMMAGWTLRHGERTFFTLPRVGVLRTSVMNHMIHHRGQLTVYLRMLGVPLPDLYGPTADTKQG